jgi:hypothetical protein
MRVGHNFYLVHNVLILDDNKGKGIKYVANLKSAMKRGETVEQLANCGKSYERKGYGSSLLASRLVLPSSLVHIRSRESNDRSLCLEGLAIALLTLRYGTKYHD